jgi:regulatory protein
MVWPKTSGAGSRASKLLTAEELSVYAAKTLARRALSEAELRTRLQRKAQDPADVDGVITKLRELGFLSDQVFAESFAAARRDSQNYGPQRVLRDLRQRRVSSTVAGNAVSSTFSEVNEDEAVETYLRRKYKSVSLPEFLKDPKQLQSAFRRLRYAGFSAASSIRVLKRYAADAEQLEPDPSDEAEDA